MPSGIYKHLQRTHEWSGENVLLFQALQVQRMFVRKDLQVCYSWTIALRQRLPTNASMQPSA